MERSAFAGSRIRERRVALGLRQAEVALRAGISGSYLNLIEHNRRRIGGKVLLNIAAALEIEPGALAQGAEKRLLTSLRDAAIARPDVEVDLTQTEDFADRFTDWARLISAQQSQITALQQTVSSLSDRLAHDPFLSEALHEVLSTVSAIRSTASILAEPGEMDQNWQRRFQTNVFQDSIRLATASQSLADYLDGDSDRVLDALSPLDELDSLLVKQSYHFAELEDLHDWDASVADALLTGASAAAKILGMEYFQQYWRDAQMFRLAELGALVGEFGLDPVRIARQTELSLPLIFRRLASLPPDPNRPPVGLMICDGSGALLFKQPCDDFQAPRVGSACALWPLYGALTQIGVAARHQILHSGRPGALGAQNLFDTFSIAERVTSASFESVPVLRSTMLILRAEKPSVGHPLPIGSTCRLCNVQACPARREPSIFTDGF
ncbi:MAG: helix-turn-helix domain-containing protein [Planktomarina sp.]|uniref:helix-turn-helix domain-containing protein n=1 Tax=Planktomarina sp. TaxID=2024851 RepID=UPI003261B6BA|nr:helix-turn-helix domain-containing protein [Planktomarina sp.]